MVVKLEQHVLIIISDTTKEHVSFIDRPDQRLLDLSDETNATIRADLEASRRLLLASLKTKEMTFNRLSDSCSTSCCQRCGGTDIQCLVELPSFARWWCLFLQGKFWSQSLCSNIVVLIYMRENSTYDIEWCGELTYEASV